MFITDNLNPSTALVKAVHHYYPVGFYMSNVQYEGFQELQEILLSKHNNVSRNSMPDDIKKLGEKLKSHFSHLPVHFEDYKQFPSYSIVIELGHHHHDGVQHLLRLVIKISLLVNYYTIYFEDIIKYNHLRYGLGPVNTTVVSFQMQREKDHAQHVNAVEGFLKECFPDYFFVAHELLFALKIKYGNLIDEELETANQTKAIFSFLFDNVIHAGLLVVE